MPKYRVLLKGLQNSSPEGLQDFVAKFAKGFKVSEQTALERVRRPGGLITAYDDEATANRARDFLISIGGLAAVEIDAPPPPRPAAPPEIDFDQPAAHAAPAPEASPASWMEASSAPAPAAADIPAPAPVGDVRACPKCGYPVPTREDECPSCHVFISKFLAMQQRRAQAAAMAQPAAPPPGYPAAPPGYPSAPGGYPPPRPGMSPYPAGPAPVMQKQTVKEAQTALIMGIVGIFCFGFVLGIFAIINGFKAASQISQNPTQLKGLWMAYVGIILGFIDIVGWVAGLIMRASGNSPF